MEAPLPVVASVTDQVGEPRYASLKGIMAAKRKTLETWSLADLGLDASAVHGAALTRVVEAIRRRPSRQLSASRCGCGRGGGEDRRLAGRPEADLGEENEMSNDIAFLAEFADDAPARSALELAAGAAALAKGSGGAAVGLAYGPGAKSGAAGLGAAGATKVVVLGDENAPAITLAAPLAAAVRDLAPQALLAPATPNGRDLAAALVGLWASPRSARSVRPPSRMGRLRVEQSTLQGSVITVSEPATGTAAGRRAGAGQHLHPRRGREQAQRPCSEAPAADDSALAGRPSPRAIRLRRRSRTWKRRR